MYVHKCTYTYTCPDDLSVFTPLFRSLPRFRVSCRSSADLFRHLVLLYSAMHTVYVIDIFTQFILCNWPEYVHMCLARDCVFRHWICHTMSFNFRIWDSNFLTQKSNNIWQETFSSHPLRRGVTFVLTHHWRLNVSHFLCRLVSALVRPLWNKQNTCKLIFCVDASFSINLIP